MLPVNTRSSCTFNYFNYSVLNLFDVEVYMSFYSLVHEYYQCYLHSSSREISILRLCFLSASNS